MERFFEPEKILATMELDYNMVMWLILDVVMELLPYLHQRL